MDTTHRYSIKMQWNWTSENITINANSFAFIVTTKQQHTINKIKITFFFNDWIGRETSLIHDMTWHDIGYHLTKLSNQNIQCNIFYYRRFFIYLYIFSVKSLAIVVIFFFSSSFNLYLKYCVEFVNSNSIQTKNKQIKINDVWMVILKRFDRQ